MPSISAETPPSRVSRDALRASNSCFRPFVRVSRAVQLVCPRTPLSRGPERERADVDPCPPARRRDEQGAARRTPLIAFRPVSCLKAPGRSRIRIIGFELRGGTVFARFRDQGSALGATGSLPEDSAAGSHVRQQAPRGVGDLWPCHRNSQDSLLNGRALCRMTLSELARDEEDGFAR